MYIGEPAHDEDNPSSDEDMGTSTISSSVGSENNMIIEVIAIHLIRHAVLFILKYLNDSTNGSKVIEEG